ncbi:Predicted metal-binding protein [Desulfotomaculum arcticum]|uniref:Predicted metal-binding protein n=1 Tax=Desulfotruncus arcticus DSM 17038 TaxID=1121424 RepID=A0A1I2Q603_9FIRM|nr:DUF2284 domain-containing protein [Desulfotruncus arcticus]SFG23905.1 Predicted metal-binding protein [Desulfotomaculum arcticum] [Desulfotruncus arcticus DSM 17038]
MLKKINGLIDYAVLEGAYKAVLIPASQIVVDERVRLKCQVPYCPNYNNNLRCPPNTMPVAKFREVLSKYSVALVVQVKSAGADEKSLIKAERDTQLLLGYLEKKALELGFYLSAGLSASTCRICDECVGIGSGLPCRNPTQSRPSAEAMGIDVIKTAERAELPFSLNNMEEVIYTGLLLLN